MNAFFRKTLLLLVAVTLTAGSTSYAGFWNRKAQVTAVSSATSGNIDALAQFQSLGFNAAYASSAASPAPAVWSLSKSKGFVIAMAFLDLIVPLGFARFALKYNGTGFLQALFAIAGFAGIFLLATGFWDLSWALFLPACFMVALGIFSYAWQVIDLIRILAKKLYPKNHYYKPRRNFSPDH